MERVEKTLDEEFPGKMVSEVAEFYKDKTVFITGGTGFVGVSVIEKLLRCCPGLKNIYLLMRPKKGKQIQERLEELTKNSVYDRIREENKTDLFKKLIPVAGDVGEDNLGLSNVDRLTLVEVVQVVIHSAVTLDFEADLKTNININLLGTRRVVELCQEIRDLKAMVHISTAYVNTSQPEAEERLYPPPADVKDLLKKAKDLDDDAFKAETPKFLEGHANSYTFTKHLAEHEVANGRIPATIVRPSMIMGAWKEPVPGWTISKNGPQGFLMGASKGVVRRLPVAANLIYDYVPVDIVTNQVIVAAYATHRDGGKVVKVYHCTSSTCNPFRWATVETKVNKYLQDYPLMGAVWHPHLKFISSLFLFKLSAFFFHVIPAYILDTVTKLTGGRPILVRLHKNIFDSLERLKLFIFTEWKFHNPQTQKLHESLSEADKNCFTLDVKPLVWEDYFVHLTMGARTYLNKESPKTLPKARTKAKILMALHLGLQAALLGLVWWVVKTLLSSTWTKTGLVVPLTYLLFDQL